MLHTTNLSSVIHVAFISENHLLHIGGCVLFDVANPILDVVERLFVSNVIHQHDAHGAAVVGRCDCAETFLKCDFKGVNNKQVKTFASYGHPDPRN